MTRKSKLCLLLVCLFGCLHVQAATVQFHAWGGSPQINQYLLWVKQEVVKRYNIDMNHVKLANTSDAVSRVIAEKSASNHNNGSVDLLWVNGENFAAMQKHHLLLDDWVNELPNFALTNSKKNRAMVTDFGLPTKGQEAPWGKAAMVFYYNQGIVKKAPQTLHQLLSFSQQFQGQFTYPQPNDYLGISFLKYALLSLHSNDLSAFYQPVNEQSLAKMVQPLWQYLDTLHPLLWRKGGYFVRHASELQRLFSDGTLLVSFSFTAAEIPSAVERYDLPKTTRTYAMQDGSLSNVHFVTIPYNSQYIKEAKQVINFLLSPEAQAKKQQLSVWGDETVLDMNILSETDKKRFKTTVLHPSSLPLSAHHQILAEPHASWTNAIRNAWFERYGDML